MIWPLPLDVPPLLLPDPPPLPPLEDPVPPPEDPPLDEAPPSPSFWFIVFVPCVLLATLPPHPAAATAKASGAQRDVARQKERIGAMIRCADRGRGSIQPPRALPHDFAGRRGTLVNTRAHVPGQQIGLSLGMVQVQYVLPS